MALPGEGEPDTMRANWTSSAFHTRCYSRLGTGAWTLRTTKNPGTTSWSSGYTAGGSISLGLAHYDPNTGLTSSIVNLGNGSGGA